MVAVWGNRSERRLFCIVLAMLLTAAPRVCAQAPSEQPNEGKSSRTAASAPDEYRFAAGLYKQQRWDLAADAFRAFLQKYPDHERTPYARLYLGLTLVNADKLSDARSVLRDYVRDYPQSKSRPDAQYRVGECSYLLDDLKAADAEFQRFLDQYPRHELAEWAIPYLADTKLRLKQPEAAKDLFQRALSRYPQSRLTEDSKFGLAHAYDELKQPEKAAELYAELAADKSSSRAPQSLMNLATIRFRAGQFDEALKAFRRVTTEFPKEARLVASAHLNAGYSLYQLGQPRPAIEEFDLAASEKKLATLAGYWKGISFKALGQYADAARVLKQTYQAQPKDAIAPSALFYWGDCELRLSQYEVAKGLFLELVQKWPQGEFSDDSLHFAGEAALLAGSVDEAERLVKRFQNEYPDSPLALHEEILSARILDARAAGLLKDEGGDERSRQRAGQLRQSAIGRLQRVVGESRLPRTIVLARYHLGRVLQEAGEHSRAVEALAPLVEQASKPGAPSEAIESLVVSAQSESLLGKQEAAIAALSRYLTLRPKGRQAEQALSARAMANAALGRRQAAGADAVQLLKDYPQSPVGPETLRRLAERAYEQKDWPGAAELFAKMAEFGSPTSELRRFGLSGLGWTRFEQKAYDESAAAFEKVFDGFPLRIPQVAEAGYMRGRVLQAAGRSEDAAAVWKKALERLVPAPLVNSQAENGPAQYAFLSGVQAANALAQLKRYDDSDAAYRLVVERFPKAQKLGQVLFDWANMLYVARKDATTRQRVREILARIVRDFPESSANDHARLFLGELDLLDGKNAVAEKTFREVLSNPNADQKAREDSLARLIALVVDRQEWSKVRELAGQFLTQFPKSADRRLVQLHLAAAQLGLDDAPRAEKVLTAIKAEILADGKKEPPDWAARVWILLAEAQYQQKKYADVESTVDELRRRMPASSLLYQADETLGRSYKNQAKWDKAISAFKRVIDDRNGKGEQNATAAKSQFMIAECWFLRREYREARLNYLKVSNLYDKLPEWAAPALFQAGQCEEEMGQLADAQKTYQELLKSYADNVARSPDVKRFADKANERLMALRKHPAG